MENKRNSEALPQSTQNEVTRLIELCTSPEQSPESNEARSDVRHMLYRAASSAAPLWASDYLEGLLPVLTAINKEMDEFARMDARSLAA